MPTNNALPPDLHEATRQKISRLKLDGTSARDKPRAIILAGQAGAGKSDLSKAAKAELSGDGGGVVIETDELRGFYPGYENLSKNDDRSAAGLVQKDASQWANELTRDAAAERRNIIIDGTLKSPDNAQRLCTELRDQGYDIDVRALAVAKEDSVIGVYSRYENHKSQSGQGRWVPKEVHDQSYDGLPKSLRVLEREGAVDRITIYRRGENGPVEIHSGPGAAGALEEERGKPRTPEELAARDHLWNGPDGVMEKIRMRDPALLEPDNKRADALAAEARSKATSEKTRVDSSSPWQKHSDQPESAEKDHKRSDHFKNTKSGLHEGPPPPKGSGMGIARQQHREAMAAGHEKATRDSVDTKTKTKTDRQPPQKAKLKRDFNRSR